MPARVTGVQRASLTALGTADTYHLTTTDILSDFAVGDWITTDGIRVLTRFDRLSEVSRKAAGHVAMKQLIAANVDTLGIVTSCNDDFNVARLERYLTLAGTAGSAPLIILTKSDQTDDAASYVTRALALSPMVQAIALDARDAQDVARLHPWCDDGQTLALVGSSGVGKTTIQNALTGIEDATQGLREDDKKGRHTTTARALRPTLVGGWLIDTPGMRGLGVADVAAGIDATFPEISALIGQCRFRDCKHEGEPGCAILDAVDAGDVTADRLARYRKLRAEDAVATQTPAQKFAKPRKPLPKKKKRR